MNIVWIAAVLAPSDVAPSPDDVGEGAAPAEYAQLADLVRGRPSRDRLGSPMLRAAKRALYSETVREAVPELAALVRASAADDPSRAAAFGLIVCAAAPDLDDYPTCIDALEALLDATPENSSDACLVRAALLQQRALRHRDAGRPHLESSQAAAAALRRVRPADCTPFPTNSEERRYDDVIATVVENLRAAIGSLVSFSEAEQMGHRDLYEWRLTAQRYGTELTRRATLERANRYADYVTAAFKQEFDRRRRILGHRSYSDLFLSNLYLELAGHGNVYAARRELGVLRLMQLDGDIAGAADALRLLRHATAKDDLEFVLRTIIGAGPLEALAADARQILRTRSELALMRLVELQVLRAAADLLTAEEAQSALDAVLAVLAAGGPIDLPGRWQLGVLRRAVAWSAAAALGNVCGAVSKVARLLLDEALAAPTERDQTFDAELRRAVSILDFDQFDGDVRQAWLAERSRLNERLPSTIGLVSARAGLPVESTASAHWLERLANDLNTVIGKHRVAEPLSGSQLASLRESMSGVRADAATGQFSMGGLNVADIAVAAAVFAGADELWPDLTAFLLDPSVIREDRGEAFDRLARTEVTLPDNAAAAFAHGIRQTIESAQAVGFSSTDVPFAAALRFAAVHGLLAESEIFHYTARLLASSDAVSRIDGVRTIALLANKGLFDGLLAMLLPYTEDENVEVRAMTAVALVQFARSTGPLRDLVHERIGVMLDADGTLVPRATLNALADAPTLINPEEWLYHRVVTLLDHPADSIRRRARSLVEGAGAAETHRAEHDAHADGTTPTTE